MIKVIRILFIISLLVSTSSAVMYSADESKSNTKNGTEASVKVAEPPVMDSFQPHLQYQTQTSYPVPPTYQEPVPDPGQNERSGNGNSYNDAYEFPLFRTIGGLGMVLCLMIGLFFVGKKYFPQYFKKADSAKSMKIIETMSMGDRRSLALIQVADKRFLVGSTPHQINLLSSIPDSVSLIAGSDDKPPASQNEDKKKSSSSFRNLFEFEKKRTVSHSGSPLPEDVRTKMRLLREALER